MDISTASATLPGTFLTLVAGKGIYWLVVFNRSWETEGWNGKGEGRLEHVLGIGNLECMWLENANFG